MGAAKLQHKVVDDTGDEVSDGWWVMVVEVCVCVIVCVGEMVVGCEMIVRKCVRVGESDGVRE